MSMPVGCLMFPLAGSLVLAASLSLAGQDPGPAEPKAEAPPAGAPQPGATPPAPAAPASDGSPDAALREFMLAMMTQDEPTLRAVTLPAEGLDILLTGQKVTGLQAAVVRTEMRLMKFRALQPGDEFTIPRGRKVVVQPGEVGEGRALLMLPGEGLPFRLQKVDGAWKVDARPVIAGRKAAAAARAKAEAKKKADAEAAPKGAEGKPGP